MTTGGALRTLARLIGGHRALVAQIAVGLVIDAAYYAVMPLRLKLVVDEVIGQQRTGFIVAVLALTVLAVLIATAAGIWRDRMYARLSADVINDLRRKLFRSVQARGWTLMPGSVPAGSSAASRPTSPRSRTHWC